MAPFPSDLLNSDDGDDATRHFLLHHEPSTQFKPRPNSIHSLLNSPVTTQQALPITSTTAAAAATDVDEAKNRLPIHCLISEDSTNDNDYSLRRSISTIPTVSTTAIESLSQVLQFINQTSRQEQQQGGECTLEPDEVHTVLRAYRGPNKDAVFPFKDLSYENYDYNREQSSGYLRFILTDTEQRLESSYAMLRNNNIIITNIEHIHFLFFNVFVLNKGIFFKIAWATDDYRVYICTDCDKKLVTVKMVYEGADKKLVRIERRLEDGCFHHECELGDIENRYKKVRLGKYRHERNKLLKKSNQDPKVIQALKTLDQSYKRRSKESEDLFMVFKKESYSIQKFKINELFGDDRRLNFYLHIISFIKTLFERYHRQLNLKQFESPRVLSKVLISATLYVRWNATRRDFDDYCKVMGMDPKESFERLIKKLTQRTEKFLKFKSRPVTEEDRGVVDEIIGMLSEIKLG